MSAIRELIEAVEAGREPSRDDWLEIFPDRVTCEAACNTYLGSFDAALALMAAVLPGWDWSRSSNGRIIVIKWHGSRVAGKASAYADTPARALLLAILRAMEARG